MLVFNGFFKPAELIDFRNLFCEDSCEVDKVGTHKNGVVDNWKFVMSNDVANKVI